MFRIQSPESTHKTIENYKVVVQLGKPSWPAILREISRLCNKELKKLNIKTPKTADEWGGHSTNELKVFQRGNRKGQYLKMQTEATLTFHITP